VARVAGESYVFGSHFNSLLKNFGCWTSGDYAHDVGFLHDQEILAIELHLGTRPLAEQHAVARLHAHLDDLAALVAATGADGDDLALGGLLFGGVGNDDAAGGLLLGVDTLDDHAVVQRTELALGRAFLVGARARDGSKNRVIRNT